MGTFVSVIIEREKCTGNKCKICVELCPVSIFKIEENLIIIETENEDECTFCNLCIEECPQGAIKIKKEY